MKLLFVKSSPNVNGGIDLNTKAKLLEDCKALTAEEFLEMHELPQQNTILDMITTLKKEEYLSMVEEFHTYKPYFLEASSKFTIMCAAMVGIFTVAMIMFLFTTENKRNVGYILLKGILAAILTMVMPKILQAITEGIFS